MGFIIKSIITSATTQEQVNTSPPALPSHQCSRFSDFIVMPSVFYVGVYFGGIFCIFFGIFGLINITKDVLSKMFSAGVASTSTYSAKR